MSSPAPAFDKNLRSGIEKKNKDTNAIKEKHWIVAACNDEGTRENVENWVDVRRTWEKDYEQLDLSKDTFQKVDPKDKLYIHCHGGYNKNKQALWIGENEGKPVTPIEFSKYLKLHKLNSQHEVLKIAACHSDEFARELYDILKTDFPKLTVYGYKGQFKACYGKKGGNLAGLVEPYITKNETAHWIVDPIKIRFKGIAEQFQAKKHRSGFGPKAENVVTINEGSSHVTPVGASVVQGAIYTEEQPSQPIIAPSAASASLATNASRINASREEGARQAAIARSQPIASSYGLRRRNNRQEVNPPSLTDEAQPHARGPTPGTRGRG
jgi:hypothetical protein